MAVETKVIWYKMYLEDTLEVHLNELNKEGYRVVGVTSGHILMEREVEEEKTPAPPIPTRNVNSYPSWLPCFPS